MDKPPIDLDRVVELYQEEKGALTKAQALCRQRDEELIKAQYNKVYADRDREYHRTKVEEYRAMLQVKQ